MQVCSRVDTAPGERLSVNTDACADGPAQQRARSSARNTCTEARRVGTHLVLGHGDAEGNGGGVALDGEVAADLHVEAHLARAVLNSLEAEVVDVRVRKVVARGRDADVDLARHVCEVCAALAVVRD